MASSKLTVYRGEITGRHQLESIGSPRVLIVATVAQSLAFQSPEILLRMADDKRLATTVLAGGADGWQEHLPTAGRSQFIKMPYSRNWKTLLKPSAYLRTARLLRSQPWALVIVSSPIAGAIVRITAPRRKIKIVYWVHGFHFEDRSDGVFPWIARKAESLLAKGTTEMWVVCRHDDILARKVVVKSNCGVIELPGAGVKLDRFRCKASLRNKVERDQPLRVCFIGDLNENKDPIFACEVLAGARAKGMNVSLSIVGWGQLEKDLTEWIQNNGATGWIELTRFVPDIPTLMANHDLLIAPSYREGLPRVQIEALASGIPVLARENRGSLQLLSPRNGFVLPVGAGVAEWVDALVHYPWATIPGESIAATVEGYDEVSVWHLVSARINKLLELER